MTGSAPAPGYDLFVSYARKDNSDGFVDALIEQIAEEFEAIAKRPLRFFLDRRDIHAMADWGDDIQKALNDAPVMLAILSPNYLESWYCRKEWRHFLEREIQRAAFGRSVQPIYYIEVPEQCPDPDARIKQRVRDDLLRRQLSAPEEFVRPWSQGGKESLQTADVRQRLAAMARAIDDRCRAAEAASDSLTNMHRPNPDFVGRVEDLRRLREVLNGERAGTIVGVNGLGGIGKTELAFTYAFAYATDYPGGRFSIACENQHDLFTAFMAIAHHFGLERASLEALYADPTTRAVAETRLRDTLQRHLREKGSTLIVLDNVSTPEGDREGVDVQAPLLDRVRIAGLIPDPIHTGNGTVSMHLLATTRLPKQSIGDAGRFCVELDALDPDDSLRLLDRHFPFADEAEEQAAIGITNRLGHHALALEMVARHLATLAGTPEHTTYASFLEFIDADVLAATDQPTESGFVSPFRDPQRLKVSMRSLLEPTLKSLTPQERLALDIAALFPPDHVNTIWMRHLYAGTSETPAATPVPHSPSDAEWNRLLRRLSGFRLLTPAHERAQTGQPEAFVVLRMHRLVQAVLRDAMPTGTVVAREEQIIDLAESHALRLQDGVVHREDALHLDTVVAIAFDQAEGEDRPSVVLAAASVEPLRRRGRVLEADKLACSAEQRFSARSNALFDDADAQRDLLGSLHKMGDLARDMGRIDEAWEHHQRGLHIAERLAEALPDDVLVQQDLSVSLDRMGDLARDAGRIDEAWEHHQRGLDIAERLAEALPDDVDAQRDLLGSLHKMGNLARAAGRSDVAWEHHQRGLAIAERLAEALPDDVLVQSNLLMSLHNMGDLARDVGRIDEAWEHHQRGLHIAERLAEALPDDVLVQHDLSVSLQRLGDLARDAGRIDEAWEHHQRGLDIAERLAEALPDDVRAQSSLSISLRKMGELARAAGRIDEAREYYQRGLDIGERLAEALPDDVQAQDDLVVSAIMMYQLAHHDRNDHIATMCLMIAHATLRHMRDRGMPMREQFASILAQLDAAAVDPQTDD